MLITEAHNIIQKELGQREQLLWAGIPRQGFVLRKSDFGLIPFSLFWSGIAFSSQYNLWHNDGDFISHAMSISFIFIGIYLLVGRFFVDIWQRNRTYYGVTDERIIILAKGLSGQQLTSIDLRRCPEITIDQQNDGSGTIIFGLAALITSSGEEQTPAKIVHRSFRLSPMPPPKVKAGNSDSERLVPAFEMIKDAKNVYNLIREAQKGDSR